MTYDPDTWDEEQLHAALSALHLDPTAPEPLRLLRAGLGELLGRPIDDAYLTLGGFPLLRGSLRDRPDRELLALPPHALVVVQDGLTAPRFYAVPASADPGLLAALGPAHGGVIGDPKRARPETHASVLRVAAGTTDPADLDTFYLRYVIDLDEEWGGHGFPVPTLEEVRAWAGALLPYRVTEIAGLDLHVAQLCALFDDV